MFYIFYVPFIIILIPSISNYDNIQTNLNIIIPKENISHFSVFIFLLVSRL